MHNTSDTNKLKCELNIHKWSCLIPLAFLLLEEWQQEGAQWRGHNTRELNEGGTTRESSMKRAQQEGAQWRSDNKRELNEGGTTLIIQTWTFQFNFLRLLPGTQKYSNHQPQKLKQLKDTSLVRYKRDIFKVLSKVKQTTGTGCLKETRLPDQTYVNGRTGHYTMVFNFTTWVYPSCYQLISQLTRCLLKNPIICIKHYYHKICNNANFLNVINRL